MVQLSELSQSEHSCVTSTQIKKQHQPPSSPLLAADHKECIYAYIFTYVCYYFYLHIFINRKVVSFPPH